MKKYYSIIGISALFSLGLSFPSYGQDDLDALLSLDLESLVDVEVTVASKRSEKISDAPGVINVVTAKEIERYGERNLQGVLGRLPGINIVSVYALPDNVASFRAQDNNLDSRTLLTIDGRPIRDYWTGGGIEGQIYRSFPIQSIKHIEIIRGPGSVLYGSGAFSGVINIVTKKAEKEHESTVTARYGSYHYRETEFYSAYKGEEYDLMIAGKLFQDDGYKLDGAVDIIGQSTTEKRSDKGYGGIIKANYKNFELTFVRGYEDPDSFSASPVFPFIQHTKSTSMVDLGYTHEMTEDWQANFNVTYNSYYQRNPSFSSTYNTLVEASVSGTINDTVNVITGITHNVLNGYDRGSDVLDNQEWKSLYFQADYRPLEDLKLIAGFQANDPERSDIDLSPRFGAIYTISENMGVKYLYGEAFRSPAFAEQNIFIPGVLSGNKNLEPEKIATQDLQLFYQDKKYFGAATLFISKIKKAIEPDSALITVLAGTPSPTYNNITNFTSQGFELEGKAQIDSNWSVQGSVSYQTNETSQGVSDAQVSPNVFIKTGVNYYNPSGVNIAVFNTLIGEQPVYLSAPVLNPPSESYNYLTANMTLDMNKLLDVGKNWPATTFSVYGENLLESGIVYTPDSFITTLINTLPEKPGRTVYGQFKVSF